MTTKLVIRLLDAAGLLLGWTEVQAKARGDGCLWSAGPVSLTPDVSGQPALVSTHWCDVNTETRVAWPAGPVSAGQSVVLQAQASPLVQVGTAPGPLPAVTVGRAITVAVPVGVVGVQR